MDIKKPTLIVDYNKASRNLQGMLKKASLSQTIFRPHFKTHQSAKIAELFRECGVDRITVSSVSMAQYFMDYGWKNICIAFPVNILELEDIDALAAQIELQVLVESVEVSEQLCQNTSSTMGIWIKIDVGYHRTGLLVHDERIDQIINQISQASNLHFFGFLTHAGHSYQAKGKAAILQIMESAKKELLALKNQYINRFPKLQISYGDTPSCSMADDFHGFDEIRPGNFIYYDVMQYHLGSCQLDDIAVAVACPVVACHKNRNEVVIYGGGVHLSKEFIAADHDFKLYGYVVIIKDSKWGAPIAGAYVSSLSQEHGIVKLPDGNMDAIKVGDILGILPVHSCMTANLLEKP